MRRIIKNKDQLELSLVKKVFGPFSFAEREKMEELSSRGCSYGEISRRLGRSKNGVLMEIKKNGGRQKYKAVEAQKHFQLVQEKRYKALSERNIAKGDSPMKQMKKQIEVLEMRINLLYELFEKQKG